MRRALLLLLFITSVTHSYSQQYGNEWIDYSQTYFKIRLVNDGLYRLTYSTLQQFGVPVSSINGNTIQIFNKGKEVPIYVTTSGILGSSDYIEFYGVHNDGEWDSTLYSTPSHQGNDRLSLFGDTACYFFTWSNSPSNNHITDVANTITNPPPKELYCWYTSSFVGGKVRDFSHLYQGESAGSGLSIWASDFVNAEGYVDYFWNKANVDYLLGTPHPYSGASATLTAQLDGYGYTSHELVISVNGNVVNTSTYSDFSVFRPAISIPNSSWITGPISTISFSTAASTQITDYNALSWLELKYPREFDFDNSTFINFSLSSNGGNQYLEIGNFNENGTTPILYDFSNKLRMEAVVENDTEKFLLPTSFSAERNLMLAANDTLTIHKVDSLWPVHFVDFSLAANQGNFIIISHPTLFNDSLGNNYVEQYRQWKEDNGFQAITVNILDLYDEFSYGTRYHTAAVKKFAEFATNKWPQQSRYIFLIGKGIEYAVCNSSPYTKWACFVPTFGYPGSDALLTAFGSTLKPSIPVGRIPCLTAEEVGDYLSKAKQFVNAQNSGRKQLLIAAG